MDVKVIVNARLVDGNGGPPVAPATLVIEKEHVTAVGPSGAVNPPPRAERIDAAGKTVLPGLIDGHMHVTRMPGMLDAAGHIEEGFKGVRKLRQCLHWGTTTVCNMGGCAENVFLRRAINAGDVSGCARMLVAAMVNATGGHVRGRTADGPWEIRKAVREMILAGADQIKTAASGGFMWEHERIEWEDYTFAELKALAEESHAKGKRVSVHAHAQPGINHAARAGIDIIAHGALMDDEGLENIRSRGLFFMPTLYITSRHMLDLQSLPEHMLKRMKRAHPIHREAVRKAHAMGVKLCAGTDGGPGAINLELRELVETGLSPMEAIVTATRGTALALDIHDRVGTLTPGKVADLIIVDGDPDRDVGVLARLDNILLVMKAGKVESVTEEWKQYYHPRD